MLKIKGSYQGKKELGGSGSSLVFFKTDLGNLELVVDSETWMQNFIVDTEPKEQSWWELVIGQQPVPQLGAVLYKLSKATKLNQKESTSVVTSGEALRLVNEVQELISLLKQAIGANNDKRPIKLLNKAGNADKARETIDQITTGYTPKLDSMKDDTNLSTVDDQSGFNDFNFNMAKPEKEKKDPHEDEVAMGTGDDVSSDFYADDTDDEEHIDNVDRDDQQDDSNDEPELDDEGPLDLSDGLD